MRLHGVLPGLLVVAAIAAAGAFLGSYPTYLIALAMINVIAAVGLNLLTGNSGQISLCHSSLHRKQLVRRFPAGARPYRPPPNCDP